MVCHDAGAANLLFAWIAASGRAADCLPVLDGPAKSLWEKHFPERLLSQVLEDAIGSAAAVITGTGWASDLEHRARKLAQAARLPSIAVVDHWTNYRQRFVRKGETILPDTIWVADEDALAEACRAIPEVPARMLPNHYLATESQRIAPLSRAVSALLYVLEPMRDDWGRGEPGEFQALDYAMAHFERAGVPPGTVIRLRPHPSDRTDKYDNWIARQDPARVSLDTAPDLAAAIGAARYVAGCQSFAMVVALAAGRRVICTLPPWAPPCVLPQRDIVHLKDCVARS